MCSYWWFFNHILSFDKPVEVNKSISSSVNEFWIKSLELSDSFLSLLQALCINLYISSVAKVKILSNMMANMENDVSLV